MCFGTVTITFRKLKVKSEGSAGLIKLNNNDDRQYTRIFFFFTIFKMVFDDRVVRLTPVDYRAGKDVINFAFLFLFL